MKNLLIIFLAFTACNFHKQQESKIKRGFVIIDSMVVLTVQLQRNGDYLDKWYPKSKAALIEDNGVEVYDEAFIYKIIHTIDSFDAKRMIDYNKKMYTFYALIDEYKDIIQKLPEGKDKDSLTNNYHDASLVIRSRLLYPDK